MQRLILSGKGLQVVEVVQLVIRIEVFCELGHPCANNSRGAWNAPATHYPEMVHK